jgi:hypothetical protein
VPEKKYLVNCQVLDTAPNVVEQIFDIIKAHTRFVAQMRKFVTVIAP